ncbi:hypothetical protein HPB50_004653 [Hyalomma asiaticum]|uniref:Uncharacterized protein n=1 Tax=Hyalomma asiaticum TaxID=266040 RepID=A0ACB7TC26_HYAAI|nr:hypothetical protein HPB50_004653 [Hyalomma asiaticum]
MAFHRTRTEIEGKTYEIFNCYSPPKSRNAAIPLDKLDAKSPALILGDFNAPCVFWGYSHDSLKGQQLKSALEDADFTLLNTPDQYTRIGCAKQKNTSPDLTWVKNLPKGTNWDTWPDNIGSDHLPILDKIECINKTCLRIATGLPKYAKVEDLYGTGLLLPIGDYVEPALQAQNERLKLTNAGRTIRNELGLSNEDLPQILPTIPPWEDITVTDNRPLPKHLNQASDKERRDYYAQRHIQFLKSIPADEDIIYTDASCTLEGSNTGAYLNLRTGEASSFFITHSCLLPEAAEGHAISEALAHYTQPGSSPKAVHIFTDSQQVIQTLQARSKIPAYARRILNYAAQLQQRSIRVRIHWIPGHTNIPGNDLVHQRALQHHSKEQLEDDSSKQTATPFQDDTHEANYRAKVLRRRKLRAKLEEATKHNAPPPGSIRLYEITMRRLQTQSFTTIPVLHKMYPTTYCDPNCVSCQVPATMEHILWECPIHESSRAAFTKRAQCTLPQLRRDEAETTHWILEDPLIKARLNLWRNALRTTVIPCPAIARTTSSPV